MARTIDGPLQTQLESPSRTELVLCFLTVFDPAHVDPIRIVCEEAGSISIANGKGINYWLNGNLHYAIPYRFARLTDDDRPARSQLIVPSFNRTIYRWLVDMQDPAQFTFEAYGSAPWTSALDLSDNSLEIPVIPGTLPKLIYKAELMWLRFAGASGTEITLDIGGYDFTQEPLGLRVTKDLCPDIYR